jgi:hypothetical protein
MGNLTTRDSAVITCCLGRLQRSLNRATNILIIDPQLPLVPKWRLRSTSHPNTFGRIGYFGHKSFKISQELRAHRNLTRLGNRRLTNRTIYWMDPSTNDA